MAVEERVLAGASQVSRSEQTRLITADELLRLPDDGWRYELLKGELIKMTPAGPRHGRIAMKLGSLLEQHASAHNLGSVYAAETGYRLEHDPDTVRAPDVSFVSRDRLPPEGESDRYWPFAPDLAVEVVSPSDTVSEVQEKVMDYIAAGTRLVWVAHPKTRTVTEYRSLAEVRVLTAADLLDGADVVPGFSYRVGELFQ